MRLTRRALLLGAAAALVTACGGRSGVPVPVAADEPGGYHAALAEALAAALVATGTPAEVQPTDGGVENVRRIADGSAAVGPVPADVAMVALRGQDPFGERVRLRALGRVGQSHLQLVVRAADPFATVADLSGRTVALGTVGSDAPLFGDRLLAVAGVTATVTRQPLRTAVAAFAGGRADALLWSGPVPTPELADPALDRPIRLLPLADQLTGLRARHGGAYGPATVPAGVYDGASPVPTVGVAALLVAAATLPDAVAATVVRALVAALPELPPSGLGRMDRRALIDTGEVRLHPGAWTTYRELHG